MFDKFLNVFDKINNTINTVNQMEYTAARVESETRNLSTIKSNKLKWFIFAIIIIIAVLYALYK